MACALTFERASAGRSIPARMAMMAMTTSSSMSVNARLALRGTWQGYANGGPQSSDKSQPKSLPAGALFHGKRRLIFLRFSADPFLQSLVARCGRVAQAFPMFTETQALLTQAGEGPGETVRLKPNE